MGFQIHDSWKTKLDNIGRSDIYQEYDSIVPAEYRTGTYATEYSEWWDYTNFYDNWWSGVEGNVFGIFNGRTYAGYSSRYGINFTTPITIYGTFSIREGSNNYSVGFLIEGRRPDGVYETITNIPATTWSSTVYNLNILDEPKGPYNQIRVTTSGSSWQSIYPHILLTKKTNKIRKTFEFPYSGSIQSIMLPPGKYKLECWGAQGGNGGLGGYSSGQINIRVVTTLYIYVGGQGSYGVGGWNGGGSTSTGGSYGGGGATDIREDSSLNTRIIVAGGGGGMGHSSGYGGTGGGLIGGAGSGSGSYGEAYGGTQTSGGATSSNRGSFYSTGGSFGQGGIGFGNSGGGGGGGWYGGGGATHGGGAGGSGYVGDLIDGITHNGVRSGNGYAKITLLNKLYGNVINSRDIYNTNIRYNAIDVASELEILLQEGIIHV